MNKKKSQLIAKLIKCKQELDSLKPNIHKCESIMTLYNKKLVEKAVLTKEIETFNDNFILKIVKKISPKQEKLICDYFN